jgi:hypothetical protein
MDIPAHIENFLGPIKQGWAWQEALGLSTALFDDQPAPGEYAIATLGFSRHVLDLPDGRRVRLEFLLIANKLYDPSPLAGALMRFAMSFVGSGQAPVCGDVFGPGPELASGSAKTHLYCTVPSIFPEGLAQLSGTDPDTIFVWVVPISGREADFVRAVGWRAFEDRLEAENAALADLHRCEIDLGNGKELMHFQN